MVELSSHEKVRRIRRGEYDRMVAMGLFEGERVELLHGVLVSMSPQGRRHVKAISRLGRLLFAGVGDRAEVRIQAPLAVSDESEPEPDVAVVRLEDDLDPHPCTALLVVEVSETSLGTDRDVKAPMYAAAGVTEYWILDLVHDAVAVYADPVAGRYTRMTTHGRGETLRVPGFPDVTVTLAEVLPPS